MSDAPKKCFVICPIGDDSTSEKKAIKDHTDTVLEFIIDPVITQLGFEKGRHAGHLGVPGDINRQIIDRLANDDLVIADLTGHNPNVFYELALRHAVRKPYIHLIKKGQNIPFDLAPKRTVFIDPDKVREVERAKAELKAQVETCMAPGFVVESPLSDALNYDRLNEGDARDRSIAVLLNQVEWLVQQEKVRQQSKVERQAATIAALGGQGAQGAQVFQPVFPQPTPWSTIREAAKSYAIRFAKEAFNRSLDPDELEDVLISVRKAIKGRQVSDMDLAAAVTHELMVFLGSRPAPQGPVGQTGAV